MTFSCLESGQAKDVTLTHLGQGLYQAPDVICGACGSQVRDVNLPVQPPGGTDLPRGQAERFTGSSRVETEDQHWAEYYRG